MANDFLTANAGAIAQVALEQLARQSVLPNLVHRDVERAFTGGVGATVTIPVPATLTARRYTQALRTANTPITLDNIDESGVPVTIDTHTYSAVGIPDEDEALNISDFARQVLAPQMSAVAEDVENSLAARFATLAATNDITIATADTDPTLSLVDAGAFLSGNKVAQSNRFLVMGSNFAARLLKDDRVSRADAAGDSTALETAQFKNIFGFTPYESLAIGADEAYAFSRDAVALATVTPRNPRGATASESVVANGITLRWLSDYDPAYLRDRSIVSVLSGTALIDPNRIVRLKLATV